MNHQQLPVMLRPLAEKPVRLRPPAKKPVRLRPPAKKVATGAGCYAAPVAA